MTLVVVRHAWAGERAAWPGDDRLRPLDERGLRQAARLPELVSGLEIRRIVSSPYLRCVQTVEPLAHARGLDVEPREELADEHQAAAAAGLLRDLLWDDAVACVHGGIEDALGLAGRLKKGAGWRFERGLADPRPL